MATAQDLARLRAMLTQLQQIGAVQTGELIRAADWNALASAVADLARTVLAAETDTTVPPHQHLDQVDINWLTQPLNDLIQRGSMSDPAAQNRLTTLEQNLQRYGAQLDSTSKNIEDFRGRLTDVATNDLARQAAVTSVQRSLNSVIDPRPDIAAMRSSLDAVQSNLTSVQQVAAALTVNGVPIDVGALSNRVTGLESFRASFQGANGQLLDAATLENEIASIRGSSVTQDQLTQAFKDNPPVIPADQINALETRLGTTLRDQVNATLSTFQTQVNGTLDSRLSTVGDLVNSRLNDAIPGVTQTVTTAVNANIATAQKSATDAANANTATVVAGREQAIRNDFASQIAAVNTGISTAVGAQVAQQMTAALQTVNASLDAASQKVDAVTAQLNQQAAAGQTQAASLAQLTQSVAVMQNNLQQFVLSQINLQVATINRGIDDRFTTFQRTVNDQITAATRDIVSRATDAANVAATNAANNAVAGMQTQLVAQMQSVARDQANAVFTQINRTTTTVTGNTGVITRAGGLAGEIKGVT
jgi:hypothetical protein